MSKTPTPVPSTDWSEKILPGEQKRYEAFAATFAEIQKRKSRRFGEGRALHRKQLTVVHGSLEVLDGLPGFARYGLFAQPRDYEVLVRISNGSLDRQSDAMPDIRGFAFSVLGVQGDSALGNGPATTQDFTLINQEVFAFARSDEFVDFVAAASHGNGNLLKFLFRRYGLGAPRQLLKMLKVAGKPFTGFATEPLFSSLPMANGPYAVRVRLLPAGTNGKPSPDAKKDWGKDFSDRLRSQALHWDLQLQFYANDTMTPIEDASVNWTTPYVTVARLMLPPQDTASTQGQALAQQMEASVIDPWHALADHRPLGDVQRARKVVYFQSQKGRGAA